jgi:type III secretion protein R
MPNFPDPFNLILLLAGISLIPFMVMMVSSFVKIVVILNLIRNALGVQQVPPNMALNGLAIILSLYVMMPVISQTQELLQDKELQNQQMPALIDTFSSASGPLKAFLKKHSTERQKRFFIQTAKVMWPANQAEQLKIDDFMVLVPAFMVSELTSAFQIGFLIYLPFIAVDLIVSNILLALGMMMVSPMTISLPFKILLFVLIEGWSNLIQGIILTYK